MQVLNDCRKKKAREDNENEEVQDNSSDEVQDDSSVQIQDYSSDEVKVESQTRLPVKEMGFGPILDYNVNYIPSIFAYRLLKSFNPFSCSFKLADGDVIRLDEADVELTFGFPRGSIWDVKRLYYQCQQPLH